MRFQLGAIFRRKDLRTLQVFRGVNAFGFLLALLLVDAFLAGGFRNALVFLSLDLVLALGLVLAWLCLGAAWNRTSHGKRKNQDSGDT